MEIKKPLKARILAENAFRGLEVLLVRIVANRPRAGKAQLYRLDRAFPFNTFYNNELINRNDIPFTQGSWRSEYVNWINARFMESRANGASPFPEVDSLEWQIQELQDMAQLRERFNLNDPMVHSFWMEYLTEFDSRADWWRRFVRVNGPCDVL